MPLFTVRRWDGDETDPTFENEVGETTHDNQDPILVYDNEMLELKWKDENGSAWVLNIPTSSIENAPKV